MRDSDPRKNVADWRPAASPHALVRRAQILRQIRDFFYQRDVIEVQTPVLGRDTVTDVEVAGIEVPGYGFLQTSPEYFLKRLLAAGVPSCYQLGPVFRADERGRHHNPEFTMLEWYRLGFDHLALMAEVQALVDLVLGVEEVRTVTYAELVQPQTDEARDTLDLRFAERCAALKGRVFITDYPVDQAALARVHDHGQSAARFELVIDGVEICNGYWELLDAAEHRQRFQADRAARAARGLPDRDEDQAFLAALDAGLPACAGVSIGIDRLVMLALGANSLDSVLAFR